MLNVTAAIIREGDNILICRRGEGGSCAFLWEFPGGKTEPCESAEQCIIRECREELSVEICVDGVFAETVYHYPDRSIAFTFFEAHITAGEPLANVHSEIKWVRPHELGGYEFCPADVEIARKLRG